MVLSYRRGVLFALLTAGFALLTGGNSLATELDEATCDQFREEQAKLVAAGVKDSMANGPEWARTNLPAARLKEVQRLIEVEEQVAFRCPLPKPVEEPTEEEEASAKAAAPAVPPPKRKPKPKANDAYVPPAKAKANDAYVPPLKANDAYVPPPKPKP